MDSVLQWSIYERQLTSAHEYQQPYAANGEPLVVARFRHAASNTQREVEGFWDGGSTWRLRFAPHLPGTWEWVTISVDGRLDGVSGAFVCEAAASDLVATNPNLHGHVRVAANRRYFEYADGMPFFLLGDTNWAMNTLRCGLGENDDGPFFIWLRDRQSKGFTAIAAELFEIDQPNEGGYPFPNNTVAPGNGDYGQLNPAYFQFLDRRMRALWEMGYVTLIHPTWIGKQVGMTLRDAIWISRYLMARYGVYNLIWSLSGEYQYSYTHRLQPWSVDDWRMLGRQLAQFNIYGHPLSIHPSGRQDLDDPAAWPEEAHQASSGGEFHDEPWLDHNWLQTGHSIEHLWRVPQRVAENYARVPPKPVIHAEGFYEMAKSEGASARMVRWQAWAAYLNGAAGHVYGAGGVWQFYDPAAKEGQGTDRFNSPTWHGLSWREALDFPGSTQVGYVAALLRALEWHRLEPHREWLRIRGQPPRVDSLTDPHLAAIPGEVIVVYIPAGNSGKRIEILNLGQSPWKARWYDPRTGEYSPVSEEPVRAGSHGTWQTPKIYRHRDYALLLQAL